MSLLVPKFTLQNYTPIMSTDFQGVGADWWSLVDLVRLLCVEEVRMRFAHVDARKLSTDLSVGASETIMVGGVSMKLRDCIIAIKLLMPTLRCCDYFFWNVSQGVHLGVDIILPKGTPIVAFQSGRVTRIKVRDGVTKNEGNCVVIKDDRGYFRGYEHLDRIDVQLGDQLMHGDQLGTCGSTGNSTQYHLHLQVDTPKTTPNPHRSTDIGTIQQKTIDPLRAIRAAGSAIKDLPYEARYQDAIGVLMDAGYIKGSGGFVFPESTLQRYEMALILHRMLKKRNHYKNLTKVTTTVPTYTDVSWGEPEVNEALLWLWQYGLMKGYPNQNFGPFAPLLFEQALALLGRSFYNLKDMDGSIWYQNYLHYFQHNGYLDGLSLTVGKPILRKDIFLLVWRVIK